MERKLDLSFEELSSWNSQKWPTLCQQEEKTKGKVADILSWTFNYRFEYLFYNSYKIEVKNWKINNVKFQFWDNKFLVYIDYEFRRENFVGVNYIETDEYDREYNVERIIVERLQISSIQKKEKAWYWPIKRYVNYFRYTWIDFKNLVSFLKELIKNYHKWNI